MTVRRPIINAMASRRRRRGDARRRHRAFHAGASSSPSRATTPAGAHARGPAGAPPEAPGDAPVHLARRGQHEPLQGLRLGEAREVRTETTLRPATAEHEDRTYVPRRVAAQEVPEKSLAYTKGDSMRKLFRIYAPVDGEPRVDGRRLKGPIRSTYRCVPFAPGNA